ncbi:hypothetical protein Sru01_17280 [Sphaerisporangium rufum]|uniref:Uncharacterized protein n=1 Tax=Sphaerisporangium rufum TaxID=1381558 RepID=A0A919QZ27_9ACTN|nr:hypothetical protein [Sphaerisporangium rufum]GII76746.1 hypothetical protein Sru01_17280 [Sphaerisporangium rufum]
MKNDNTEHLRSEAGRKDVRDLPLSRLGSLAAAGHLDRDTQRPGTKVDVAAFNSSI